MHKGLRLLGVGLIVLIALGSAAAQQSHGGARSGVEQRLKALEQRVSSLETELKGIKGQSLKLTNCRTTPYVLPDTLTNCNQKNEVVVNVGGGHRDSEVRAACCQLTLQ